MANFVIKKQDIEKEGIYWAKQAEWWRDIASVAKSHAVE